MAGTHSITRRAFVRAASAVTAVIGTGTAAIAAVPAEPTAEETLQRLAAEFRAARDTMDDAFAAAKGKRQFVGSPIDGEYTDEWNAYWDAQTEFERSKKDLLRFAILNF